MTPHLPLEPDTNHTPASTTTTLQPCCLPQAQTSSGVGLVRKRHGTPGPQGFSGTILHPSLALVLDSAPKVAREKPARDGPPKIMNRRREGLMRA